MLNVNVHLYKQKNRISKGRAIKNFVVFFITLAILAAFVPQNTHAISKSQCEAAGGTYSSQYVGGSQTVTESCNFNYSPDQQIASYSYYNAISQCMRKGWWKKGDGFNPIKDPSDPKTWASEETISVGYIVDTASGDGKDGLMQCNTMIKPALKLWGYDTNYPDILKEFGYTTNTFSTCNGSVTTETTCKSGPIVTTTSYIRPDDLLSKFQQAIKKRVYDGNTPTLEGRADLLYRRGIFHIESPAACNATPYKKMSDLNADEKKKYVDNQFVVNSPKEYMIVRLVNGTSWTTEDWVYKIADKNTTKTIKLNEKPEGGSSEFSCMQLARDQAGYADRVAADAGSMIALGQDPATKYGEIVKTPGASNSDSSNNSGSDSSSAESTSCAIEGIGWIVCPVATFIGGLNDGLWAILTNLLQIQPRIFDVNGDTYRMWSNIRNIANIAFVIVFIIIIYSQLTGLGVSNYGVKKMLPRLIIAAILVNISFFICALAVDLSNIAGSSLHTMFTKMAEEVSTHTAAGSPVTSWSDMFAWLLSGGAVTWGGVAAVTALGTYGFWGALALLLPSALAALLAFIMVVVLLLARQAFVIILSILAPLALVAYLLPNTNQWFDRWRKFFITLLIMFPTVAILFGGSELAAGVIRAADSSNGLLVIGSLAITALPLFALPALMKASGGLMNRIAGVVNNPNRGPIDKLKKRAEGFTKNQEGRRAIRALSGDNTMFGRNRIRRQARRKAIGKGIENNVASSEAGYIAKQAEEVDAFRNQLAGGTRSKPATGEALNQALANAINVQAKLEADEVTAAKAVIEHANLSGAERQQLALSGSVTKFQNGAYKTYDGKSMQTAAIQEQMKTGSMEQIHTLVENSGSSLKDFRRTIAQGVAANGIGAKDPSLGGSTIDMIANGSITNKADLDKVRVKAVSEGKVTAEVMANMHDKARAEIIDAVAASGDTNVESSLKASAARVLSSRQLRDKVTGNKEAIRQIDIINRM